MSTFIQSLESLQIFKDADKYKNRVVNKEDIRENMELYLSQLNNVAMLFAAIPPGDRRILAKKIVACAAVKGNLACETYCKVAKTLRKDDLINAFSSYISVCLSYKKILEQFNRSLDKWFSTPKLTVYSTKLSHLVLFGLLDEVKLFCKFTTSLFGFITYEVTTHNSIPELQEPKRYKKMMIAEKYNEFASNCIRRLSDNPYVFAEDMEKARNDIDVNIVDANGNPNTAFVNPVSISAPLQYAIGIGSKSFVMNIFRWIGEQWMMHKHLKYLRDMKDKEWAEAHVALLKLDLDGTDPNSEEYRKLVAIIDNYNEQIAELDQKIAAYEQED